MARKRELPPELFLDPAFNSVPVGARLFYIGLLFHLDYHGVQVDDAAYLHKTVFQCDAKMQRAAVTRYIDDLCKIGRLTRFVYNGVRYLYAPFLHMECRVYPDEFIIYDIPIREIPGYNPEFNRGKLRVRRASSSSSSFTSTSTPAPDRRPADKNDLNGQENQKPWDGTEMTEEARQVLKNLGLMKEESSSEILTSKPATNDRPKFRVINNDGTEITPDFLTLQELIGFCKLKGIVFDEKNVRKVGAYYAFSASDNR